MRAWALALLLLMPIGAAVGPLPPAERPWWERTLLDGDGDRLDDALGPLLARGGELTVLVGYARMPGPDERADVVRAGGVVTFAPTHFPLLAVRAAATDVPGLARLPGVVLVEANDEIRLMLAESVPLIGANQAWQRYSVTGKGVTVAVLDDGAFEQHPDFSGKIAGRFNAAARSEAGVIPLPGGNDAIYPAGENGHGTHVAGTIVGAGGQSGGKYKGVAPGATFVNVQVFSAPNRTNSDIVLRGLDWVLENRDALGIRIAQMSLGGRASDGTDALSRAVDIAIDEGLIVVAAAGNAGPNPKTVTAPGAAEKAITVGAVDKRKAVASFSSRGPTLDGRVKPDIAAPGRNIMSTVPPTSATGATKLIGGQSDVFYGSLSGTSMAAPHVAGVVALMLEANPDLTPRDVKRILLATAQDLGPKGPDTDTGYGFLNGVAAVQVADNPALLQSAQFREVLATIPDPPEESFLERLNYEVGKMQRDGTLPILGALVLLVALAGIVAAVVAVRRRRKASPPP